jgi:hypothetical protein
VLTHDLEVRNLDKGHRLGYANRSWKLVAREPAIPQIPRNSYEDLIGASGAGALFNCKTLDAPAGRDFESNTSGEDLVRTFDPHPARRWQKNGALRGQNSGRRLEVSVAPSVLDRRRAEEHVEGNGASPHDLGSVYFYLGRRHLGLREPRQEYERDDVETSGHCHAEAQDLPISASSLVKSIWHATSCDRGRRHSPSAPAPDVAAATQRGAS